MYNYFSGFICQKINSRFEGSNCKFSYERPPGDGTELISQDHLISRTLVRCKWSEKWEHSKPRTLGHWSVSVMFRRWNLKPHLSIDTWILSSRFTVLYRASSKPAERRKLVCLGFKLFSKLIQVYGYIWEGSPDTLGTRIEPIRTYSSVKSRLYWYRA